MTLRPTREIHGGLKSAFPAQALPIQIQNLVAKQPQLGLSEVTVKNLPSRRKKMDLQRLQAFFDSVVKVIGELYETKQLCTI